MTQPLLAFDDAGHRVWDAIVLGAGPAGAIAARQLAASGARILLVEKKAFPRGKVCGACLNESALGVLESVGLSDRIAALGGTRLDAFQLGFRGRAMRLALPAGMALSRARFDAALVDAAVASGAAFLPESQGLVGPVQADVRRVVLVQADRSITATARVVLIATGLGQAPFQGDRGVRSHAWGRSRVGAGCSVIDYPDFYQEPMIFMAVGRRGYVGLVRVEGDQLNVAAAFARELIKDCGSPGAAARRILAEAGFPSIPALASASWQGTVPLTRRDMASCRRAVFRARRRGGIRRALHGRRNGLGHDVREGRRTAGAAGDRWLGPVLATGMDVATPPACRSAAAPLSWAGVHASTSLACADWI